jgi:hypothetical protein
LVITTAPDIRVKGVHIDDERLMVELMDGRSITVPLAWYPCLFFATAKQRQSWKLAGGGYGIHWPDIDENLSTEGLLRGAPAPRGSATSTKPRSRAKPAPRTGVD